MSLKFQEIGWDDLMYVAFDNNGEILRWYPRWKDVGDIFDSAWATEHDFNKEKLTGYLLFVCLKILIRSLLIKAKSPEILKFNQLTDQIEAGLLEGNGEKAKGFPTPFLKERR